MNAPRTHFDPLGSAVCGRRVGGFPETARGGVAVLIVENGPAAIRSRAIPKALRMGTNLASNNVEDSRHVPISRWRVRSRSDG